MAEREGDDDQTLTMRGDLGSVSSLAESELFIGELLPSSESEARFSVVELFPSSATQSGSFIVKPLQCCDKTKGS